MAVPHLALYNSKAPKGEAVEVLMNLSEIKREYDLNPQEVYWGAHHGWLRATARPGRQSYYLRSEVAAFATWLRSANRGLDSDKATYSRPAELAA